MEKTDLSINLKMASGLKKNVKAEKIYMLGSLNKSKNDKRACSFK